MSPASAASAATANLLVAASEFDSRNWAFLRPDQQARLREQVVFAAGTGLASRILTLACRTGFTRFIVADGDVVEVSNLNRQAFSAEHVGRNKAEATAEILRSIRPGVAVETIPRFLNMNTFREPLSRATLAISSIDWDNPALFAFNAAARELRIPVLIPINIGWGGAVLAFAPESPMLEEFIGYNPARHQPADIVKLLVTRIFERAPGGPPPYLDAVLASFMAQGSSGNGESTPWQYDPQLGVAAYLTSALTVRAAVALATGEPVRVVPEVIAADVRVLAEPTPTLPDDEEHIPDGHGEESVAVDDPTSATGPLAHTAYSTPPPSVGRAEQGSEHTGAGEVSPEQGPILE